MKELTRKEVNRIGVLLKELNFSVQYLSNDDPAFGKRGMIMGLPNANRIDDLPKKTDAKVIELTEIIGDSVPDSGAFVDDHLALPAAMIPYEIAVSRIKARKV
jgi:hypothetical protein